MFTILPPHGCLLSLFTTLIYRQNSKMCPTALTLLTLDTYVLNTCMHYFSEIRYMV